MSLQEQTKTIIEDSIASPYMDTFNMSNLILSYCLNENANTRFYIYINLGEKCHEFTFNRFKTICQTKPNLIENIIKSGVASIELYNINTNNDQERTYIQLLNIRKGYNNDQELFSFLRHVDNWKFCNEFYN